jgi:hypothetical protein
MHSASCGDSKAMDSTTAILTLMRYENGEKDGCKDAEGLEEALVVVVVDDDDEHG